MNPRNILKRTRLVEVEDEARGEHVGGLFADHHGTPGSDARCLDAAFVARGIGTEPCPEHHRGVIEIEVHGREVEGRRLVDVEVQSVSGLHLQSGLHAGLGESGPGPAAVLVPFVPQIADLRQF